MLSGKKARILADVTPVYKKEIREILKKYKKELAELGVDSQTTLITTAIDEYLKTHLGINMPPAVAPNGLRAGVLKNGWLSRFYTDRYQVVMIVGSNFVCAAEHFHKFEDILDDTRIFATIKVERPFPAEIFIIDVPVWMQRDRDEVIIQAEAYYARWIADHQL